MSKDKKIEESVEENITLADIVEDEADRKILAPVPEKKKTNIPYTIGSVITATAYLREEPDGYSTIKRILKKDETVVIDADRSVDDYYMVTISSLTGYVLKENISVID